jgi:ABC-type nitrate/sulfonate/bicarbonate transport system permease component
VTARSTRAVPDWALGVLSVVVVLVALEALSRSGVVSESDIPPVSQVLGKLVDQLGTREFWTAVAETLRGWGLGLAISVVAGVVLGLALGLSEMAYGALRIPIEFLRPIPSVALVPLAVLLYGTGLQSTLFLVCYAALWPILLNAIYGVRDVEPVALDTGRMYGLGRIARLRHIVLPSAVPYIATGVRVASSIALILAVTAELVIGSPGLGRSITVAESSGAVDLMYALVFATGILGFLLNFALRRVERHALRWHPSQRAEAAA